MRFSPRISQFHLHQFRQRSKLHVDISNTARTEMHSHSSASLRADGLQSHKPQLQAYRPTAPFAPCHQCTEAGQSHRASSTAAAGAGIADISVRSRGLFHFHLCLLSNSVPAPAGIAQTQEGHMSSGGRYICKCVDTSPLLCHRVTAALTGCFFLLFFLHPSKSLSSWKLVGFHFTN